MIWVLLILVMLGVAALDWWLDSRDSYPQWWMDDDDPAGWR